MKQTHCHMAILFLVRQTAFMLWYSKAAHQTYKKNQHTLTGRKGLDPHVHQSLLAPDQHFFLIDYPSQVIQCPEKGVEKHTINLNAVRVLEWEGCDVLYCNQRKHPTPQGALRHHLLTDGQACMWDNQEDWRSKLHTSLRSLNNEFLRPSKLKNAHV